MYFSHRQLVLHTLAVATALGSAAGQGRVHRDDVYMPITPMFHVHAWGMPYLATMLGMKQVYPGRYVPETLLKLLKPPKLHKKLLLKKLLLQPTQLLLLLKLQLKLQLLSKQQHWRNPMI